MPRGTTDASARGCSIAARFTERHAGMSAETRRTGLSRTCLIQCATNRCCTRHAERTAGARRAARATTSRGRVVTLAVASDIGSGRRARSKARKETSNQNPRRLVNAAHAPELAMHVPAFRAVKIG